ncbi:MAG TPA: nitroreductase [Gemmatimonadales bacterium]|nr:nitroreductase [Gemmatimonadales bacterium]
MTVQDAIRLRRSIKEFTPRPVTREEIEALLELAVLAPNHRLTEPLRFHVLGPAARRRYGEILGSRKAKKVEDHAAAQALIDKVAAAEDAVPALIAVSMVLSDNAEVREEDYATAMMAVQNLMLGAVAMGLGTHFRSGAVMDDPRTRELVGVGEGERIVALVQLGEPAAVPDAKARKPAAEVTRWVGW